VRVRVRSEKRKKAEEKRGSVLCIRIKGRRIIFYFLIYIYIHTLGAGDPVITRCLTIK
jgi:hypothetical protein